MQKSLTSVWAEDNLNLSMLFTPKFIGGKNEKST